MNVSKTLHLIGFGSQGMAWAQAARKSGLEVKVYLRALDSDTAKKSARLGFETKTLADLGQTLSPNSTVAFLCPDDKIGAIYRDYLSSCAHPLVLVLAHGYAIYSGDLKTRPEHEAVLFAPKVIGPKLLQTFEECFPQPHSRVAAIYSATPASKQALEFVAQALGFQNTNLIETTFEKETIGDLISEQALLCGGLFPLLEWTVKAMQEAGIPPRLIREECLSELELVAGLINDRGPAKAFAAISPAAKRGTILMRAALEKAGVDKIIDERRNQIESKAFVSEMQADEAGKTALQDFEINLKEIERSLL